MMVCSLAFTGAVHAQVHELTVHDGTATSSQIPLYGSFYDDFTKSEFVLPASELTAMNGGTITGMKFYISRVGTSGSGWDNTHQVVFLKEVGSTTLGAYSGTENGTVVFDGTFTCPVSGQAEFEIAFSTPYTYNGGNLLVGIYNTDDGGFRYVFCYGEENLAQGVSARGANPVSLDAVPFNAGDFLPKTTFSYTGGGVGFEDQLHVKCMDGGVEVIDALDLGVRPVGAWMEPFRFTMYSDGPTYTVNVLDFTPSDGMFSVSGQELPFQVSPGAGVGLTMGANGTVAGVIARQFVAITEGSRAAHIWPVTVELYDPAVPDVVEKAHDFGTIGADFSYVGVPASITPTVLHDDYTLPFPEVGEGVDAVYKMTFDNDVKLNASVSAGASGKVALYTEDFYGEGGPMSHNNYTGPQVGGGGGGAAAPFEAQVGEGTSTTGYSPFFTLYNYSISENLYLASELNEAGVTTAPMSSLSWYATNAPGHAQQGISIWMANVPDAELTTTSHVVTGMTLVYTGAMTPAVGWNEFVFNEGSFAWDGHSSVLIFVQRNNGAWNTTVNWQATSGMSFNAMAYARQDGGAYDVTVTNTVSTSTTRPNIIFKSNGRGNRDVLFTDDFESGNLDNWTLVDSDNDGDNWIVVPLSHIGDAHSGSYMASSWSWNGVSINPDNWMISPEVGGATGVQYFVATNALYPDHYAVMASSSGTGTGDFTLVFEEDAPSAKGTRSGVKSTMTVGGDRAMTPWTERNIALPAGTKYVAFRHYNSYDNNYLLIDDVTVTGDGAAPVPPAPTGEISFGPVVENAPVEAGTYYLVASSTSPDFEVTINAEAMPCPDVEGFAFGPTPADNADSIEPASVTLRWNIPDYATGWRLVFGSTYYPEPGHPQTVIYPEDGGFSGELANSYTVTGLWNNTNYFWRVEFNNGACEEGESSPVWGFTTHLNVPQGLTVVDETVFDDEQIVLNWTAVVDRTYRQYNVYRDGELIGNTMVNDIGNSTYTDGPLGYNMTGYTYHVTAVYDEGESAPSDPVTVKVSGYGDVNGHVYEQDGETGIAGATVTMVGQDEFGDSHTYSFTADGAGYYSGHIYAGSYSGSAACNGYQTVDAPVQGNPVAIAYDQATSPVDYILDENFDPVCTVIAQYYPDSLDPESPYVKVYWGCGLPGGEIVEDFETGDFSMFDWQVDPSYPWTITTNNPYEGTYCMKSGGAGVANVVSDMTVTVNIPSDGKMSFFGKISSEQNWDYGYFYIDGQQMGSYTGDGSWGEKKFDITAGDHTFRWRYKKDFSVNSNDDCFYVDNITFYKQPEPVQPGWHTYCESEFNNAVGSNLTPTPSWAYEYPAAFLNNGYAGWNITKVSLFSDDQYSAVGGNYTCRIYAGGSQPAAGTMVSTITVDVPSNQNAWVDWDLTTPVAVTGAEPIWVVWTANTAVSSWPAGCCGDLNDYGTWWDGGQGWEHLTYGTWTMRHWFTNRSGRSEVVEVPVATTGNNPGSSLRSFVKGDDSSNAVCANPNAERGAAMSGNTRAFSHYRVYRTDCYNDGPYTEENTVVLACELHDTVYIDVSWPDAAPGVYKWGVGCVYVGNRGEETEGEITWSGPVGISNAAAAREVLFTDDFESGNLDNWTLVDSDNDGDNWIVVPLSHIGDAHSGSYMASSWSWNGVSINPDNWMISPEVGGATGVQYFVATNALYPDHYAVMASSSGTGTGDFTLVFEEDAPSAKGTRSGVKSTMTVGGDRAMTPWTERNIALPAGTKYVAFRHYNSYDNNYLLIDDVTVTGGGGGVNPGGGNNPIQEPRESEIVWSNCLDKSMSLTGVTVNVLLNSADSPEGTTVDFVNLNAIEQTSHPVGQLVLDSTGFYAFDTFRKGEYAIKVQHEGYEPIDDTVSIWEDTDLRYVMTEILYSVNDLYVSSTGWAMWEGMGTPPTPPTPPGTEFTFGFEEELAANGWTIQSHDATTWERTQTTGFGAVPHEGEWQMHLYWSWGDQDEWLITPEFVVPAQGNLNFWMYGFLGSTNGDHYYVKISTDGGGTWTELWDASAQSGGQNHYDSAIDVDLSAYAGQSVKLAWQGLATGGLWYAWCIDDITVSGGREVLSFDGRKWYRKAVVAAEPSGPDQFGKDGSRGMAENRHLEYYKVMCTSIDGEPIFNTDTEHPFCQVNTESLVEGDHYICKVAAVYSTGMGAWSEVEWQYIPCNNYGGTVDGLTIEGNTVSWVYPGNGPVPPPFPVDDVTVILRADDVWGDGSGYQMLLDPTHSLYGTTIPTEGPLSMSCTGNEGIYNQFEYKIPENADGNCSTQNIVVNNSVTITIPAGAYDWCIANPTPNDRIWIASSDGNIGGRYDDFEFEAGKTYEFHVYFGGYYDATDLTVTGGAKSYQSMGQSNNGCKSTTDVVAGDYGYIVRPVAGNRDILLEEHFTNGLPGDWIALDADGDSHNWEWTSEYKSLGSRQASAFRDKCMMSESAHDMGGGNYVPYTPNNYLITPMVDGAARVTYKVGSTANPSYCAEHYAVCASSTGTAAADFSVVMEEDVVYSSGTASIERTVELPAGTKYVAFRHFNCTDLLAMLIDDVVIEGSANPNPNPGGDILGAMIFVDGEWEAFVAAPTNSYTYTGGGNEVCVRVVYNGDTLLPNNNIYYSMSCPECGEFGQVPACEPGAPITGVYKWNASDNFGSVISWGEQPVGEWLFYDNGENADAIHLTSGGQFYVAVMFPKASLAAYSGCSLTKVSLFDYEAETGDVMIYAGGDSKPGDLVHTQPYTITGSRTYVEFPLTSALALDVNKNLWVVLHCTNAAIGNDTGDANGRWISVDGNDWYDVNVATGGQITGTWNLRGFVTNATTGKEAVVIEAPAFNGTPDGVITHTGISLQGDAPAYNPVRAEITKYNVYRSTENANYSLIGSVNAVAGQAYYEYFDAVNTIGNYYYQVKAVYDNGCESEPAQSAVDPANNYVTVNVTSIGQFDVEANLYPNPTSGNVTIQAAGMNRITVVSALGQVVYDAEIENDMTTLNMGQFTSGVYMVRIATATGVSVKRVTVVK